MKEFNIEITETLARVITVEANSIEEALEQVINDYKNAEIVLDANDFVNYEIEEL